MTTNKAATAENQSSFVFHFSSTDKTIQCFVKPRENAVYTTFFQHMVSIFQEFAKGDRQTMSLASTRSIYHRSIQFDPQGCKHLLALNVATLCRKFQDRWEALKIQINGGLYALIEAGGRFEMIKNIAF